MEMSEYSIYEYSEYTNLLVIQVGFFFTFSINKFRLEMSKNLINEEKLFFQIEETFRRQQ